MEWSKARGLLGSFFSRDDPATVCLSRRDMLAGMGLVGLLVSAPKLLASGAAEAGTINTPSAASQDSADTTHAKIRDDSAVERTAEGSTDATDLSAQYGRYRRYWRRRYRWRRRYWRRRYRWHRRYWRRRYWRRRYYRPYWRRRYGYRRYW